MNERTTETAAPLLCRWFGHSWIRIKTDAHRRCRRCGHVQLLYSSLKRGQWWEDVANGR